jgi:hypothetical protein
MTADEFQWFYERLMEKLSSIESLLERALQPISYDDVAQGTLKALIDQGIIAKKEDTNG